MQLDAIEVWLLEKELCTFSTSIERKPPVHFLSIHDLR